MKLKLFSIYDCKSEAYMVPQAYSTRGQAVRAFTEAVADKTTSFAKWPEDFTLFELGEFDDSNAKLDLYDTPYSLGKALEFIKPDVLNVA